MRVRLTRGEGANYSIRDLEGDQVPGKLPASLQAGDILAIRGTGFFARGILAATGNTVSHVGMVLAPTPGPLAIEALWRVKTRPLSLSIQDS